MTAELPERERVELDRAIAAVPWRATVYIAPHEYVMAKWGPECGYVVGLIRGYIRTHGEDRLFQGKKGWRYFDYAGYSYWMMPRPVWGKAGFVLNRKVIT